MDSTIWTAILALLAIPFVTSGLTALVRKLSDSAGIPPRVTVYAVALAVTGLLTATGSGSPLPACAASAPDACAAGWLLWAGATGALAEAAYRTLQPILAPDAA